MVANGLPKPEARVRFPHPALKVVDYEKSADCESENAMSRETSWPGAIPADLPNFAGVVLVATRLASNQKWRVRFPLPAPGTPDARELSGRGLAREPSRIAPVVQWLRIRAL